jgi:hypothetical protein
VDEPDDRALLVNGAVKLALTAEELVERVGRIDDDDHSRRRAIGAARRVERLAAALADELSRVDPATYNGRSP